MPPRRLVSLIPAATEMIFALGAGDRLVGRSHECDFPWEATRLPVVTRTRLKPGATSDQLHQAVLASSESGQSLFQLDVPQLQALEPDLILLQDQCGVCAISAAELESVWGAGSEPRPQTLVLSPQRFADLWTDLRRVGRALELPDEGRAVIAALKARVVDVIERVGMESSPPTVACLEWISPLMGSGNWIPELVELAGGQCRLGKAGAHSQVIPLAELEAADPDRIVVFPCGFDLERTEAELKAAWGGGRGPNLRALRESEVYAVDGSAYFNRPGPRLVDSLELLAEILHPSLYPKPRYEGSGWRRFRNGQAR